MVNHAQAKRKIKLLNWLASPFCISLNHFTANEHPQLLLVNIAD
jgi:hypothetical protein